MPRHNLDEWHIRHNKRPDVNLRRAIGQIELALKKAAVWEHRIPEKTLDRMREARNRLSVAEELIDAEWPDPPFQKKARKK